MCAIGFCDSLFVPAPWAASGSGAGKERSTTRSMTILNLINFPIGTFIGAYALYALLQDAAADYFSASKPD